MQEKIFWRPYASEMSSLLLHAPQGNNLLLVYTSSKLQQPPCQFNLHLGAGRGRGVRDRGLWPLPDRLPGEVLVLFSQLSSHSPVHDAGGATAALKLHSPDCAVCQACLNLPSYSDFYTIHTLMRIYKNTGARPLSPETHFVFLWLCSKSLESQSEKKY